MRASLNEIRKSRIYARCLQLQADAVTYSAFWRDVGISIFPTQQMQAKRLLRRGGVLSVLVFIETLQMRPMMELET